MQNSSKIQASFIPLEQCSEVNQLADALNQIQAKEASLHQEQKVNRQRLATRLIKLRQLLFSKIKLRAAKRQNLIINQKLSELSELSKTIYINCYRDGLKTIKTVCENVFSQNTAAYDFLLQASLDKAFKELEPSKILKLEAPESILNKHNDSKFQFVTNNDKKALIHCKAGTLIIDPISEIQSGFEDLENKLENMLRQNHDSA